MGFCVRGGDDGEGAAEGGFDVGVEVVALKIQEMLGVQILNAAFDLVFVFWRMGKEILREETRG